MEGWVEPKHLLYSSALQACAQLETAAREIDSLPLTNKSPAIMPERNLVSWKAMIVGYAKNGLCQEAMKLMYRMRTEGFEVDDYILATVLTACGELGWEMDPSFECSLQSS
ncbi:unnamed protein product [Prunus armeniaca]|uniref:Pentacotripeptide-repeat region of PRORP domain-containing protein n=1 Tax=Prunus armeniaca TaxID=36596 RepID=A0A6J5W7G0_PRUAR|nr:unnamed protein product [Prunus armeniaca]